MEKNFRNSALLKLSSDSKASFGLIVEFCKRMEKDSDCIRVCLFEKALLQFFHTNL